LPALHDINFRWFFATIYGRKPFILLTFAFFAIFPLALMLIPNASLLPLAFIIAGLREIVHRRCYSIIMSTKIRQHLV